jgi:hypothetical protein
MPYKDSEKQKTAMREAMRRQRAKLVTFSESTAAVILWMENVAKKGYSLPLNLAIVQTPERLFYRILTLGTVEEFVQKLNETGCKDIVYFHPKKFRLLCTEDPETEVK